MARLRPPPFAASARDPRHKAVIEYPQHWVFDGSWPNHIGFGMTNQPLSEGRKDHSRNVKRLDPRVVLWENVSALMVATWGKENLTRLSREAKIGPASCSRIKEMQTSVGLDVVDKIAEVFSLEMWQLLTPMLDPTNPPATKPISQSERQLYERLMASFKQISMTP